MALPKVPSTILLLQLALLLVTSAAEPIIQPSLDQARLNAFPIFNSIHSAMRQWGSSLNHNGLAMIPAKIPKGGLLYHGTHNSDTRTKGLEWLAFEPEHSEIFAISWRARQKLKDVYREQQTVFQSVGDQAQQVEFSESGLSSLPAIRGYLRTYQASRDLNLLYLDGMSAAKGCLGPIDTQDLVLRLINGTTPCDSVLTDIMEHDMARVGDLCAMLTPLGYDGLLRMEVGFEIVYCDFDDGGLHLLSQLRRPFWDQIEAWYDAARMGFHLVRAATQHYGGVAAAARVQLDFSRMVSAYFYPVNVTNPDADGVDGQAPARILPRLTASTYHERRAIQRRVKEVASVARDDTGINWQAIVDSVVSRYADRLALLAQLPPAQLLGSDANRFEAEIFVATNTYVEYPSTPNDIEMHMLAIDAESDAAARTRCQYHYLQQVEPIRSAFTPEDHLIYASIGEVIRHICGALFEARSHLQHAYHVKLEDGETRQSVVATAAGSSQEVIQRLVKDLNWTKWEKCSDCAVDELCFLPMFPYGSKADGKGPHCLNASSIDAGLDLENNYWDMDFRNAFLQLTEPL